MKKKIDKELAEHMETILQTPEKVSINFFKSKLPCPFCGGFTWNSFLLGKDIQIKTTVRDDTISDCLIDTHPKCISLHDDLTHENTLYQVDECATCKCTTSWSYAGIAFGRLLKFFGIGEAF